jgi:hypothetical protein
MMRREISREELFAMVWERPTQAIANELGISDVAIGKLCMRLQVPKPPRGYLARVQLGRLPGAHRSELIGTSWSGVGRRLPGHERRRR